jgi:hypothetical protein
MGDLDLLIGKWTVWVKDWTWEYEFQRDGRVTGGICTAPRKARATGPPPQSW